MDQEILNPETADYELIYAGGNSLGPIQIAPGVIARIAEMAVRQVEGVRVASKGGFSKFLRSDDSKKRVEVELGNAECQITLYLEMVYGTPMSELAYKVQREVKTNVERMTGRPVTTVNVMIVGLYTEQSDEDE